MERAVRLAPYITILVAVIACLPSLGIPIGLAAEGDALDYRIPILKWMARHHAYPDWPWTFVEDYPMLGELLMFPFFLIKQELARVVPILAYLGTAWFGAMVGAEVAGKERGHVPFYFASLLGFQPILVQACHVMVDNVAACFSLATLLFALRGRAKTAGFFAACAMATRYSAWGAAPAGLAAYLLAGKGRPRDALWIAVLAAFGALPFVLRNLALNGSPVYPLLDGFFHGEPFTALNGWGRGKGPLALLLFPYDLFYTNSFVNALFDTRTDPHAFYTYRLGFLTYVQLAVAAIVALRARAWPRGESKTARAAAAFGVISFFFWWSGSQNIRFLGAALSLLDLAFLYAIAKLAPPSARILLAVLPVVSIWSVQQESWKIAFGKEASFRESGYVASAANCFRRAGVPEGVVMGYSTRDALNGYFDYDFVFLPPNNLYRLRPGASAPRPDFIYSGFEFPQRAGYEKWPAEKPCLLRRVEAAH